MDHVVNVGEIIERELGLLPGWCSNEKGKRMAELTRGSKLCVELGVFGGRGLVSIALALGDQGFGRAHGIDPFTPSASLEGANDPANDEWWSNLDYEAVARSAQTALYNLALVPYAQIIRMRSLDVVGFYPNAALDLLHQDSNHSEKVSCEEIARWAPKMKKGGYWIADDTNWPTMQKAQRELRAAGFVELEDHETWKVYRAP